MQESFSYHRTVSPMLWAVRLLRLKAPIEIRKRQYDRVALRVCDAAPFDAAMAGLGITVR